MAISRRHSSSQDIHMTSCQSPVHRRLTVIISIILCSLLMHEGSYAALFTPAHLTPSEQQQLSAKLIRIRAADTGGEQSARPESTRPAPNSPALNAYDENDAEREIVLSEKELNALIAQNPQTARYVAVHLSRDLISVRLLVPMDQAMPLVGGKLLGVTLGIVLQYINQKPVIAVRGMSLGKVPLPQAWWGDIKNINLVDRFAGSGGFWDQLFRGVDNIEVQEGQLRVRLSQ